MDPVGPRLARRHDHEIRLRPAQDPDGRLVAALVDDRLDHPERRERVDERGRLVGLGQDVEVADRLLAATEGAGRLHRPDAGRRAETVDQGRHELLGPVQPHPVEAVVEPGDALEHESLGPGGHPADGPQPALLGGPPQVVHRLDAELRVELADGLGAETGDLEDLDEARRDLGPKPVVDGHVAGRGDLPDLVRDGLADARDGRRVAGAIGRHEVDRAASDGIGGSMVGDGLEHELALELEHVADLVEDPGEVAVGQVGGVDRVIGHRPMVVGQAATTRSRPARLARYSALSASSITSAMGWSA